MTGYRVPFGSLNGVKSLEQLSDYHSLIKDFDTCSCMHQLIIECEC